MPKALPFSELTKEKLHALQARASTKREFQRVQCVYLRQHGASSKDIAVVLALSAVSVKRVWSAYREHGEEAFFQEQRGGRYRENMTKQEEEAFLAPFLKKANEGGVLIVNEIHHAYAEKLQRRIPKSTLYAILHRHGWRKIAPRPTHPKGNVSAREIFKVSFPPDRVVGQDGG